MIVDIEMHSPGPARIYQCTCRDGIGFLITCCFQCPDAGLELMDCKGNLLCIYAGHAGDPCPEFAIDIENK